MLFSKKLFFVVFFVVVSINAMKLEDNSIIAQLENPGASDFQIYQLLSCVTNENLELYLPNEVTCIIASTACQLTKKLHAECYKKYGKCLSNPGLVLGFVEESLNKSMSQATIVAILKACLSHSGKSLDQIQYYEDRTVLHCLSYIKNPLRLDALKILLLVAGDKAWDLIIMQDYIGCTALHLHTFSSVTLTNELLSAAPSLEELWELICTETETGDTVLYYLLGKPFDPNVVKKILTSAPSPEAAWLLINKRNCDRKTVLDLALNYDEAVREILESYRPTNL